MIVIFRSDAYENITMFGDIAQRLLKMMGYEVTAGGIKIEDIPQALARLKTAIDTAPPQEHINTDDDSDSDDGKATISLSHRALPLVEMLAASEKAKCDITWKSN